MHFMFTTSSQKPLTTNRYTRQTCFRLFINIWFFGDSKLATRNAFWIQSCVAPVVVQFRLIMLVLSPQGFYTMLSDLDELPSIQLGDFVLRFELEDLTPTGEETALRELRETPENRENGIKALRKLLQQGEFVHHQPTLGISLTTSSKCPRLFVNQTHWKIPILSSSSFRALKSPDTDLAVAIGEKLFQVKFCSALHKKQFQVHTRNSSAFDFRVFSGQ